MYENYQSLDSGHYLLSLFLENTGDVSFCICRYAPTQAEPWQGSPGPHEGVWGRAPTLRQGQAHGGTQRPQGPANEAT